ncbi:MAG: carboxypeptidase-like regulatory domain-containing protein, partial [Cyclobacteriaceae bacterium]
MRKNLLFVFILLGKIAVGQSISGKIYDAESGAPLIGATIKVMNSNLGTTSDISGDYKIDIMEPGVYALEVRYVGYRTKQIQELFVNRDADLVSDFALAPNFNGLDSLIVTERQLLVQPGKLTITQEQLNRFAATYYDPARMMTTSSDILVTNDQNNQISVRGISPAYNIWRLEGAEILNPNHLANAGTFSDQATSNGGGVNILSAQMMSRSSFDYGAFGAELGNSVGGIFNMNIKDGGAASNHVVQASLIGLDFSSEGKVGQNDKLTYAANYRYSFTGLLANFGVDFGGEKIGFQDLSFSLKYQINPKTDVKLFALGGLNFNMFTGLPFEESEDQKDRSNIDFDGEMGAIGAT